MATEAIQFANKEVVRLVKESGSGWDDAWKIGITPWDSGDVQPPLHDLISSNELDLPKLGRALVPGCGRGYDAGFIASHLGLEYICNSNPGCARVRLGNLSEIEHLILISVSYFHRGPLAVLPDAKVSFDVIDFFSLSVPDDQRFALIYDYTFFVAIPPVRRSDWGKTGYQSIFLERLQEEA